MKDICADSDEVNISSPTLLWARFELVVESGWPDEKTWSQFKDLLPLIGVVLGYVAGFMTTWFNDRRQYERERIRWIVEQQVTTLTGLGDGLRDLIEQTHVVIEHKREAMGRGTAWPEFVDGVTKHWVLTSHARVLLHRVEHGSLRQNIGEFVDDMEGALRKRQPSDAMLAVLSLTRRWEELNKEIGNSLRNLYPSSRQRNTQTAPRMRSRYRAAPVGSVGCPNPSPWLKAGTDPGPLPRPRRHLDSNRSLARYNRLVGLPLPPGRQLH